MDEVPMTYHASVSSCGIPRPPPDDYSTCYRNGDYIGPITKVGSMNMMHIDKQTCESLGLVYSGTCFRSGKTSDAFTKEFHALNHDNLGDTYEKLQRKYDQGLFCGTAPPPPEDYSMCYYYSDRIGTVVNTPSGPIIQYTADQCKLLNGTMSGLGGTQCFKPGKTMDGAIGEWVQLSKSGSMNETSMTRLLKKYTLNNQCGKAPAHIESKCKT